MASLHHINFDRSSLEEIRKYSHWVNWPVVYLLEDGSEMYVGQSYSAYRRAKQHLIDHKKTKFTKLHLLTDEEYNMSATTDIESSLIQYMAADGKFLLQNGNKGLKDHEYFDRPKYQAKFEIIWETLKKENLVTQELRQIRNSDLFKYSPYKSLKQEQYDVAEDLLKEILTHSSRTIIVRGGAGTGKTVMATYLFKLFKDSKETQHLKVGLVVPVTALRQTLKKVFKNIKGLKANMVISPSEVVGSSYDILLVDESHRLHKRKNITNFRNHDLVNKALDLGTEGDELDWVIKSSRYQIFFYDPKQNVHPSGVSQSKFEDLKTVTYDLNQQLRLKGGDGALRYERFIQDFFANEKPQSVDFGEYDFRLFDDFSAMVSEIKEKETQHSLARMISGYAWEWVSKKNPELHDIEIQGVNLKWNSVNQNWVYSDNAINEVGCIHTVQGYDLNYAGLIIGPELGYDESKNEFVIYRDNYKDKNGRNGVDDLDELKSYILNIYQTLMLRGVLGIYVYVVDPHLRKHLKKVLSLSK